MMGWTMMQRLNTGTGRPVTAEHPVHEFIKHFQDLHTENVIKAVKRTCHRRCSEGQPHEIRTTPVLEKATRLAVGLPGSLVLLSFALMLTFIGLSSGP